MQRQVHPGQPHEPGWLGGELNGNVGWFPEAYVELATASSTAVPSTLQPIGRPIEFTVLELMNKMFCGNVHQQYR